jgi:hypothetical protein
MDLISWTQKQMRLVIHASRRASTLGQSVAPPAQQQTNIPALSPLTAAPVPTAAHTRASIPPPTVMEKIDGNYVEPQGTIVGQIVKCEQPKINEWDITLGDGTNFRKFNVEGIVPNNVRAVLNSTVENTKTNDISLAPTHVRLKHNSIEVGFLSKNIWEPPGKILQGPGDNRSAGLPTPRPVRGVGSPALQVENSAQGR